MSVSLSGSPSYKITLSILSNQLVHCGVIYVENISLEDLVRYHFLLWIGMFSPYHTCFISDEEEEEGEPRRQPGGRRGGRESTTKKRRTYGGYEGVSMAKIFLTVWPSVYYTVSIVNPQEEQGVGRGGGGGGGVSVAVD